MPEHPSPEHRNGVLFGIAAYTVWGISPLFWNLVDGVGTADLVEHRILWAIPILLVVILTTRRWPAAVSLFRDRRRTAWTALAGLLLITNWTVFLWAVTNGHVVDASLGYFINPLVSVGLGVVFLHERLRPTQWWAVGIATMGVLWMTVSLGTLPWVALILAGSFGVYGLIKKRERATPALVSLFGEVAIIAVPAVAVITLVGQPSERVFGDSIGVSLFLVAAGAITVIPLVLFGAAARRIPLTTVGLLQYIAPTLQFLIGVAAYGEDMGTDRLIGFAFVWLALGIYGLDGVRRSRTAVNPTVA